MTVGKAQDFGRWYQELVVKSEMIEYSDISGAPSFFPFSIPAGFPSPAQSTQLVEHKARD